MSYCKINELFQVPTSMYVILFRGLVICLRMGPASYRLKQIRGLLERQEVKRKQEGFLGPRAIPGLAGCLGPYLSFVDCISATNQT